MSFKQLKLYLWILLFTALVYLAYQNSANSVTLKFLGWSKEIPVFLVIFVSVLLGCSFYLLIQFFYARNKNSKYKSDEI